MKKPKVISLFSGCGGMDLGFTWAGYQIVWANDILPDAVQTYKENIGKYIELGDITDFDIKNLPDCDIVVGGPPCQSFSLVGKRNPNDIRGNLIWNFYEIITKKKPKIFLMENVPGLKAAKDNKCVQVLPELLKNFEELGYSVNYFILNAADYGVPQRRKRLLIVGNKNGYKIPIPEPTHTEDQIQRSLISKKEPWVTCKEALSDLSPPAIDTDIGYYTSSPNCDYQKFIREGNEDIIRNHQMPYMSETDLKIIKAVPIGGNYMDVPDNIATTRIKNFKKTGGRTTTYGKIDPSKPGYTLNTHFSRPNVGCNIHYEENRLITIREGLRLQSFPDKFRIIHNSKRSAYIQVGNAVPPLLAYAISKHLLKYF